MVLYTLVDSPWIPVITDVITDFYIGYVLTSESKYNVNEKQYYFKFILKSSK